MNITANGDFEITGDAKSLTSLFMSGEFGPATVKLIYFNGNNDPVDLTDGAMVSGEQYEVNHGYDVSVFINVAGADVTTDFYADIGRRAVLR